MNLKSTLISLGIAIAIFISLVILGYSLTKYKRKSNEISTKEHIKSMLTKEFRSIYSMLSSNDIKGARDKLADLVTEIDKILNG